MEKFINATLAWDGASYQRSFTEKAHEKTRIGLFLLKWHFSCALFAGKFLGVPLATSWSTIMVYCKFRRNSILGTSPYIQRQHKKSKICKIWISTCSKCLNSKHVRELSQQKKFFKWKIIVILGILNMLCKFIKSLHKFNNWNLESWEIG